MKAGLATILAALVLAADARADVFVPDDPPGGLVQRDRSPCAAAAGDTVVASAQTGTDTWVVRVSEAGRPWRRLPDGAGCPKIAAAADGTAVIVLAGSDPEWLVLRPPGGTFGAPIAVEDESVAAVAAAPGGWVALALRREQALAAMVVGPGGATGEYVLDDGRDAERLSAPAIGIDASGTASAVWTHWDTDREGLPQRIRTARSGPGGTAWTVGTDLPAGSSELFPLSGSLVDVALSPAGRTLIAWVTGDGVRASLDGEPDALVGVAPGAGTPVAAVGEDGSALVAFAARGSRAFVAERPAGSSGWLPQRRVASGGDGPLEANEGSEDGPREVELDAEIRPNGAAVVAWQGVTFQSTSLRAVTGRPGGGWSPVVTLSSPARRMSPWSLGGGRLLWAEGTRDLTPARLRGARLAPDAPLDVQPPDVRTRLPARVPATRSGMVRVRVPVRCAEACDVRLTLAAPVIKYVRPFAETVRALPAGGSTTLRLSTDEVFANYVAGHPGYRRLRLSLEVFDRAGNVTRRSSRFRVRVIERPLRSYKVGPRHDFAMFSRAGDRAVGRLVNRLIEALASGTIGSERDLQRRYVAGASAIARAGHDEIGDTDVREAVFTAMMVPCLRSGYEAGCVPV